MLQVMYVLEHLDERETLKPLGACEAGGGKAKGRKGSQHVIIVGGGAAGLAAATALQASASCPLDACGSQGHPTRCFRCPPISPCAHTPELDRPCG